MTGTERGCVPRGSFELDPASLPTDLLGTPKQRLDLEGKNDNEKDTFEVRRSWRELNSTDKKCSQEGPAKHSDGTFIRSKGTKISPSLEVFFDFNKDRSNDKFQVGQIWAFDYLSLTYGQITKIETSPYMKINMALLESCKPPKGIVSPAGCGLFKVQSNRRIAYPSSCSHLVKAHHIGKNIYEIYPSKGEIWGLNKSWNADMSHFDLQKCGHKIVVILNDNDQRTKVSSLVRVTGFRSVFRAERSQRSNAGVFEVPRSELGRFYHQIPAFQLTGEKDGLLRGCWELDYYSILGLLCRLSYLGDLDIDPVDLENEIVEVENVGDAHAQNLEGYLCAEGYDNVPVVAPVSNDFSYPSPPEVGGSAFGASAPKVLRSRGVALRGVSREVLAKSVTKVTGSNPTPQPKRRKLLKDWVPVNLANSPSLPPSADKGKEPAATEEADQSFVTPELERIPVSWSLRNKMLKMIPECLSDESTTPKISHSIMDGMDHMAINLSELASGLALLNAQVEAMRIAERNSRAAAEAEIGSLCTKLKAAEEALNSASRRAEDAEAEGKKLQKERVLMKEKVRLAEERAKLVESEFSLRSEEAAVERADNFVSGFDALRKKLMADHPDWDLSGYDVFSVLGD
ncbi:hypothetical protein LguiA_018930 [Lonicera macranthoides]